MKPKDFFQFLIVYWYNFNTHNDHIRRGNLYLNTTDLRFPFPFPSPYFTPFHSLFTKLCFHPVLISPYSLFSFWAISFFSSIYYTFLLIFFSLSHKRKWNIYVSSLLKNMASRFTHLIINVFSLYCLSISFYKNKPTAFKGLEIFLALHIFYTHYFMSFSFILNTFLL